MTGLVSRFALVAVLALAACDDKPTAKPAPASTVQKAQTPIVAAPPVSAASSPVGQAINAAAFDPAATDPRARRDVLIRVQTLLDRAHFSPGVIDGRDGGNLTLAIRAFQKAHDMTVDGEVSQALLDALLATDGGPVLVDYTISQSDVAGPFMPPIPKEDYEAMAREPAMNYHDVVEMLAERFHMGEDLLRDLNPGVNFNQVGATIMVTAAGADRLDAKVDRIEIDKALGQVRAFDESGAQLAVYPATVGSTERPAPSGEWAVRTLAPRPTYTYDPSRLTFGEPKAKLTIQAGPNNPVGSTWIDLTKDTYGIHGTPDPKLVNKRASHGCVRLTNWDASELGSAVKKGAKVIFIGVEARPA
ncbi:murein L,D-transpeptidase [Caulobacter segnis]|uniref:ErfK/YbiS/YcfS/YnhG family protein n=2 Tax=Caulobacter segnis TaxID=88688 RepID=D5VMG3_CAUST|nr:murein L,D-transpeptidase [Caulobacter segnis]ADG11686.1 ErfK/YbiS/YcfS/YnhG family protein [Caulobacter segnis ATCC 21756]AVQ03332.1 murein L,D-transpeptidase [Caulobacter segnis]